MAQTTPNFGFNIAEGTDTVNLLTQCYPNFTSLDSILQGIKETGVTTAVATKTGTNFAVVRTDTDCNFFRFIATANYAAGDTFTVDGVAVTATSPAGTALPAGAFVINQSVIAVLNSSVLTLFVGGGASTVDAEDVDYDNSVSGLTATDVQAAIDEVVGDIPTGFAATAITYDNTVSGLTAINVQNAIDELKTLIPTGPNYITTGLTSVNGSINRGGYYIENGTVFVDITVTLTANVLSGNMILNNFPGASAYNSTPPYAITALFNNACMGRVNNSGTTFLGAAAAMTAGTEVHFIGSYNM